MKSKTHIVLLALASLSGAASILNAQAPQAVFRPALIETAAMSSSYSGESGYKDDMVAGKTSVQRFDASVSGRISLGRMTFLNAGAAVSLNTIESDASVPVPEKLAEMTLDISVTHLFSDAWKAAIYARPGYYGDLEHYTSRTLNAPVLAAAMYTPSPKYTWLFGVSINPIGQYPVMPVLSLRWAFAEDWAFNFGFPRFGVTWQAAKALELGAQASMQGGTFRVTKAPNSLAREDLANTYLTYREIRAGVRAAYKCSARLSLGVEVGWMADRRFDYFDRDYELKGKSSSYATVAIDLKM